MPSLDTAMSYHRLKRASLDDREVFTNLRDLMDYCDKGARYDGQRVVVTNELGTVEYVIKNNIPIINMRGSEPIFKNITFYGDNYTSHGLLIYEHNYGNVWDQNEVFIFDESKLCIISQLEIFGISDGIGNKSYKFCLERYLRGVNEYDSPDLMNTWSQNYNPYTDGNNNIITQESNVNIQSMSFITNNNTNKNSHLITNDSKIILMPKTEAGVTNTMKYITKIYVKAEDYYNAWK